MGGGSAQVNPPYQVSVAEGLAALLGDGSPSSTASRSAPGRARPRARLRRRPGDRRRRACASRCYDADGAVIEERHAADGDHDRRLRRRLRRRRSRRSRLPRACLPAARRVGALGRRRLDAASRSMRRHGRRCGCPSRRLGEEILGPPAGRPTSSLDEPTERVVEADRAPRRSAARWPASAVRPGRRPAPPHRDEVIATRSRPPPAPTSRSSSSG